MYLNEKLAGSVGWSMMKIWFEKNSFTIYNLIGGFDFSMNHLGWLEENEMKATWN